MDRPSEQLGQQNSKIERFDEQLEQQNSKTGHSDDVKQKGERLMNERFINEKFINRRFMKNKSLKIKLAGMLAGIVIVLLSATSAFAYADFDTTEYNVQADVQENGLIKIHEQIKVDVADEMHGIYRYIPLTKNMPVQDKNGKIKTKKTLPLKISKVNVKNERFEKYKENGNLVIKIGDEDEYVSGKKTYDITYNAQLYDDGIKDYDTFIYNLLPHDWETPIESAVIKLNMPKKFDRNKIQIYCDRAGGSQNQTDYGDESGYKTNGKKVLIHAKNLAKGVGITAYIRLPQGYFKDLPGTEIQEAIVVIVGFLLAALALLLWFLFGRDRKIVKTVEFESPDGIAPSEIGYIVDGTTDKKDVIAMIFHLAQKGYLSIEETEKKDIIITKEKDLPEDAKGYERTFIYGLLAEGTGSRVSLKNIDKSFYTTYKATAEQITEIYKTDSDKRIFPKSAIAGRLAALICGLIGYFAVGAFSAFIESEWGGAIMLVVPALLMFGACVAGAFATDSKFSSTKSKIAAANIGSILMLAAAVLTIGFITKVLTENAVIMIAMAVLTVCVYFAYRFMMRRTRYGAEIMGRILGFRDFIELAEVDKLKAMVEENPSYFYDILPYAYVFGLSKKWAKKFEQIPTSEPFWYHGYYGNDVLFNTMLFYHMFNRFDNMARENITIPTDSGGIGGGFSGGGFGGGGGGGW